MEQARESSSLQADFGDCALVKVQRLSIGCYSNLFLTARTEVRKFMHLKRLQSSLTQLARVTQLPPLHLSELCPRSLSFWSKFPGSEIYIGWLPTTNHTNAQRAKLNGLKGDKNISKMPTARAHPRDFGYKATLLTLQSLRTEYGLLCISIFSRRTNVCI